MAACKNQTTSLWNFYHVIAPIYELQLKKLRWQHLTFSRYNYKLHFQSNFTSVKMKINFASTETRECKNCLCQLTFLTRWDSFQTVRQKWWPSAGEWRCPAQAEVWGPPQEPRLGQQEMPLEVPPGARQGLPPPPWRHSEIIIYINLRI